MTATLLSRVIRRQLSPTCKLSTFRSEGGADEVHLFIEPSVDGSFAEQVAEVVRAYDEALETLRLPRPTAVFRRLFLSDAANQLDLVMDSPLGHAGPEGKATAVSCIEQPPVCHRKLALLAYHISDVGTKDKRLFTVPGAGPHAHTLALQRGRRRLLWSSQLTGEGKEGAGCSSAQQTSQVFGAYRDFLARFDASLLRNTLRTWVFVQNVDTHYAGMVKARRELFSREGLTPESHYIVSTGIEGRTADPRSVVTLDALAATGLEPEQVHYLDRLDRLNRTDDYGVTFERAARVDYADRRHLFVAGTASIDCDGQILHHGDVLQQVHRTLENITALLQAGGAELDDLAEMIVYLRDGSDAARVTAQLETLFPALPFTTVEAPVCRPGWLVEIEGLAILPHEDSRWTPY